MLVLQLALPRRVDFPDAGIIRPFRLDELAAAPLRADPVIVSRALFSPTRGAALPAGTGSAAAPQAPLGGASAAGIVRRHGTVTAFLQVNGSVIGLGLGATYRGWTLVRAGADGLSFRRGREQLVLPLAAAAAAPAAAPVVPAQGSGQ